MNDTHFIPTPRYNTSSIKLSESNFSLLRLALVLIARGGFVLVQSGTIPTEQFYDLLLHNIIEFSITSASYGLFGCILAFGRESLHGIAGYGNYSTLSSDSYCTIVLSNGILTTCLGSRLHFIAYTIVAFVYSGLTQPLLLHAIYHPKGWMNTMTIFNRTVTMHDHAGALCIHLSSGLVSVIGLWFLGRRLLKLRDIDEYSLSAATPTGVTFGYMLIVTGFLGYSMDNQDLLGEIFLNNILSISGGGIASAIMELFICKIAFNFWVVLRVIQGSLIGLTVLSSTMDLCFPPIAFGVALTVGLGLSFASKEVFNLGIEDYCHTLTIHLIPGIWAPVIQTIILAINPGKQFTQETLANSLWFMTCTITASFLLCSTYSIIFVVLWCSGVLRNESERNCHRRSLNIARYSDQCPLRRIFRSGMHDDFLEPGISGKTPNASVHIYQQKENLRNMRIKYNDDKSVIKKPHELIKRSSNTSHSVKNMFTTHNIPDTACTSSHPFASGDTGDITEIYKLEELIGNSDIQRDGIRGDSVSFLQSKLKPSVLKKKSFYKLTKSAKYLDFPRKKRIKPTWTRISRSQVNNRQPIPDASDWDAKYNDGFVTIKLPSFDQYLSD